jgi:hypothetical protein
MMLNVVGSVPDTCPWQSLRDPVVHDVLAAWQCYSSGQVSAMLTTDPPAHLIEGLRVYGAALDAVRADRMDRDAEQRARSTKGGGRGR